jgi:hypothetical protein
MTPTARLRSGAWQKKATRSWSTSFARRRSISSSQDGSAVVTPLVMREGEIRAPRTACQSQPHPAHLAATDTGAVIRYDHGCLRATMCSQGVWCVSSSVSVC